MGALEGHSGTAYYYIRTLVNKYHPWVLLGIVSAPYFLYKSLRQRMPEMVFPTVWIFFILSAITLIRTKLGWYILPLYPALSLTVGFFLAKMLDENRRRYAEALFLLVLCLHIPYSHVFRADYSRDLKGIAQNLKKEVPADEILYLYNYHEIPAAAFYLERKSAYLDSPESFISTARGARSFFCLVHETDWKAISAGIPNTGLTPRASFEGLLLISK